jgi:hypothetical protein
LVAAFLAVAGFLLVPLVGGAFFGAAFLASAFLVVAFSAETRPGAAGLRVAFGARFFDGASTVSVPGAGITVVS